MQMYLYNLNLYHHKDRRILMGFYVANQHKVVFNYANRRKRLHNLKSVAVYSDILYSDLAQAM